ncbi:hypothetical protein ACNO8X_08995 [Mycobacterium sp. PDNC021]|uniref:hypothetical protein n=1 Tax=Mycobacterium sp. PDNC021 TaxID=3391399 RepID=UPI003AAC9AD3
MLRTRLLSASAALAVALFGGAASALPLAWADPLGGPGQFVDMGAQCAAQYPGVDGFLQGEAYLVAPGDAYSWRCKRVSASRDGGLIADLSVNPNAFCTSRRAAPIAANPPNWACAN